MDTTRLIDDHLNALAAVITATPRDLIEQATNLMFESWRAGGTTYVIGNGGSAANADGLVCDFVKMTTVPGKPRFRCLSLATNMALITALVNDEGAHTMYSYQLESLVRPGDIVLALSVHGGAGEDKAGPWSQNVLQAIRVAQARGAKAIGLAGYDGGAMKDLCDVCIVVPAFNTQHVEDMHLAVGQLMCVALREKIQAVE